MKSQTTRTPHGGRPYYCTECGAGLAEFMACEEVDCRLESVEAAELGITPFKDASGVFMYMRLRRLGMSEPDTTELPRHISERDVMRHVAWLASERRHTTERDVAFCYAEKRGWCRRIDGIMPPHERMFRVQLTQEGLARMAMPDQPSAGEREFLSWRASL